MLSQPVNLLKLMLNLSCMFSIQERELNFDDFARYGNSPASVTNVVCLSICSFCNRHNSSSVSPAYTHFPKYISVFFSGMNQYPEEYSGYGQPGNSMQAMGFHQGGYENSNMVSLNLCSAY